MKVKVSLTVDVNAEAWMGEYGVDRADVPRDVRDYFQHADLAHLDDLGFLVKDPTT